MSVYHSNYFLGTGRIRSITGTDPAAGVQISESVPAGVVWHLWSMRFTFTTDVTVANRYVRILVDDGANIFAYITAQQFQTASLAWNYTLAHFGNDQNVYSGVQNLNLPQLPVLLPGWRLRTNVVNFQAGDDFGAPQLLVEEWYEE